MPQAAASNRRPEGRSPSRPCRTGHVQCTARKQKNVGDDPRRDGWKKRFGRPRKAVRVSGAPQDEALGRAAASRLDEQAFSMACLSRRKCQDRKDRSAAPCRS